MQPRCKNRFGTIVVLNYIYIMKAKIASAPTLERLTRLLNEYYYSTTYNIVDGVVYNSKGVCNWLAVEVKRGRYTIYHCGEDRLV